MWKYTFLGLVGLGACTTPPPHVALAQPQAPIYQMEGRASYYGGRHNGRVTSSGAVLDGSRLTAAHPTLPFGTKVQVTNLMNSRTCVVEITDRGPAPWTRRVIDVSEGAAQCLEMIRSGVAPVRLRYQG